MFYRIKEKTVNEPIIELPKGSKVVSVKHECEQEFVEDEPKGKRMSRLHIPESWTVVYLEPVSVGELTIERIKGGSS